MNVAEGLRACTAALGHMAAAARHFPQARRAEIETDLANRHGWLALAYESAGDMAKAEAEYRTQEAIVDRLTAADPRNMDLREKARARLNEARGVVTQMIAFDPSNAVWAKRRERIDADLARLHNSTGGQDQ